MNPLEYELVVSVVVVAVVLDLVSTPDVLVLVVVLVYLVSPVVLVPDEIAVVVDPCVIAVSMVRQRYMKCDTQLLYGTSGPTVSEDGSCRASDTCALQGYVQMCMRSTLCSGDRHTTGISTKKARDKLGILLCSNTAHVTVA